MGHKYAIFDSGVGRCGIVWSDAGIVSVQLPEAREIETRRRLFKLYPEAREQRPPLMVEGAIEGIAAQLRGQDSDLSQLRLDLTDINPFQQRTYELTRAIPRGETRTYAEIATRMRRGEFSVAQALAKNPFMIIVPCHRVLESAGYADKISANGGVISKRRLLGIEGLRLGAAHTLFDVLLPLDPPRPPT